MIGLLFILLLLALFAYFAGFLPAPIGMAVRVALAIVAFAYVLGAFGLWHAPLGYYPAR